MCLETGDEWDRRFGGDADEAVGLVGWELVHQPCAGRWVGRAVGRTVGTSGGRAAGRSDGRSVSRANDFDQLWPNAAKRGRGCRS